MAMSSTPLAAPTSVTAANRVRVLPASAGSSTVASYSGAAATSGREPCAAHDRADGRLGDQQPQWCTEEGQSHCAGPEVLPVLIAGSREYQELKDAPLRKKTAVTAVRGPIDSTLRTTRHRFSEPS